MGYLYRYSDTGAPTLSGTAGALAALLDAVLVNGYNSNTVSSITVAGGVATINYASAHGYQQAATINLSGANEPAWNNDFFVLSVPTGTSLTVSAGALTSPPTGTITTKNAPAGWSIAYTATNKRVYQSPNAGATKLFARFDDTGTATAVMGGYVTMSDVDTGTESFYSYNFTKSSTADSVARPWVVAADDKYVHIFSLSSVAVGTTPNYAYSCFGDVKKDNPTDAYNFVMVNNSANGASGNGVFGTNSNASVQSISAVAYRAIFARSYTGVLNSSRPAKSVSVYAGLASGSGVYVSGYASQTNAYSISPDVNGVKLERPVYAMEYDANSNNVRRGEIPGLLHVNEKYSSFNADGTAYLAGATNTTNGVVLIKVVDKSVDVGVVGISLDGW